MPWNGALAAAEIAPGNIRILSPFEFTVFGEIRKRKGQHIVLGRPRAIATGTLGRRLRILFQQQLVSLAEALNCVDERHTFGLSTRSFTGGSAEHQNRFVNTAPMDWVVPDGGIHRQTNRLLIEGGWGFDGAQVKWDIERDPKSVSKKGRQRRTIFGWPKKLRRRIWMSRYLLSGSKLDPPPKWSVMSTTSAHKDIYGVLRESQQDGL
ncbi:hypothetical protein DFH09DRAFT_1088089 [Mycena vulgaris]|nr:hypothetical protein DFH09DRAFT_1088089 [Mycena vulgaris]